MSYNITELTKSFRRLTLDRPTTNQLQKKNVRNIMNNVPHAKPNSSLEAAVIEYKTCRDNMAKLREAFEIEKKTISDALMKAKHGISPYPYSYLDLSKGHCMLNRNFVCCNPSLKNKDIGQAFFDTVDKLNYERSNATIPQSAQEVMEIYNGFDITNEHTFITSMGLVPNKRMTNQSTFSSKCEFGSLEHKVTVNPKDTTAFSMSCILGKLITQANIELVTGKYRQHTFHARYMREALCNLSLQAGNMNNIKHENGMHSPEYFTDNVQCPLTVHAGYVDIKVYKSTHILTHRMQNGTINYGVAGLTRVYKTEACINVTTIVCIPRLPDAVADSTDFLYRAFNNFKPEYVLAQHVNYRCTYFDGDSQHSPDIELKLVTVNRGFVKDGSKHLSAIVHEFGNGPGVQFEIYGENNDEYRGGFFGFDTRIASEIMHQSTLNSLHAMISGLNTQRVGTIPSHMLLGWGVYTDKLKTKDLLVNLKKNIIPYNTMTDEPDKVVGRWLNGSFDLRELGLRLFGPEECDIGCLHRAELVAVICPISRPFDTDGLNLWIPGWDIKKLMSTREGSAGPMFSSALSVCGSTSDIDMDHILAIASQPSEFDSELYM